MIHNLQHVMNTRRPFWRFAVKCVLLGQNVPVEGFIWRPDEGVTAPWIKFGRQGSKGQRRTLVPLSADQRSLLDAAVRAEVSGAWSVYQDDREACRKLHPADYRGCVLRASPEAFLDLPEGRLWPDSVLDIWLRLTAEKVRDAREIVWDREHGILAQADYDRLIERSQSVR